jgi:hypothetical protein
MTENIRIFWVVLFCALWADVLWLAVSPGALALVGIDVPVCETLEDVLRALSL